MLTSKEQARLLKSVSAENERLVEIFDSLGDANRCKLFRLVVKQPGIGVSEAAKTLKMSLPLASQHLKLMVRSNLLFRTKVGRSVTYMVNDKDPLVKAIINAIKN